jgi:plastocyanin
MRSFCNPVIFTLLAAAAALAADHVVLQKDRNFSNTELAVKAGDTITFKNADEITHNVFSISKGLEFDIRRQAPGGSSTVTFQTEGVAEVRCSIHPKMKLLVSVKK